MVHRMSLSLSSPDITETEIALVNEVLHGPRLSMGPMIERFEAAVAEFVGTRHAVAVSSGTAGLHLALIAALDSDLAEPRGGPSHLVLTTPFSFVASANCILYVGAIPVFVDIDPHTLNLDPQKVKDAVEALGSPSGAALSYLPPSLRSQPEESGYRLSALLPVHIFGQACEMKPLMDLASRYGLTIVEDACEALGTQYRHRQVGSFGDGAVFAFYPNKQITTGEGGVITTDRDTWAELFRSLRNQGRDSSEAWLNHVRLGYNYRLDELSAALGVAQMARVEQLLAQRAQVAEWYRQGLAEIQGVIPPVIGPATTRMGWFVYVIRLRPEIHRDVVMEGLARRGVPSRPYFPPIHLQPFYRNRFGYREGDFPITEQVARSTLALPFHGRLTEGDVACVCQALQEVIGGRQ